MARNEVDKEAIAKVHEIASCLGLAIYETMRKAMSPSKGGINRQYVIGLWTELADKIIDFALEDN